MQQQPQPPSPGDQVIIRLNKTVLLINLALITLLALSFVAQWFGWFRP